MFFARTRGKVEGDFKIGYFIFELSDYLVNDDVDVLIGID